MRTEFVCFECCDYDLMQEVMATLSQGRNIRYSNLEYRCGWRLIDREDGDWCFEGTISQILVLQFYGLEPWELPF